MLHSKGILFYLMVQSRSTRGTDTKFMGYN